MLSSIKLVDDHAVIASLSPGLCDPGEGVAIQRMKGDAL
jgi:hypothetical protein